MPTTWFHCYDFAITGCVWEKIPQASEDFRHKGSMMGWFSIFIVELTKIPLFHIRPQLWKKWWRNYKTSGKCWASTHLFGHTNQKFLVGQFPNSGTYLRKNRSRYDIDDHRGWVSEWVSEWASKQAFFLFQLMLSSPYSAAQTVYFRWCYLPLFNITLLDKAAFFYYWCVIDISLHVLQVFQFLLQVVVFNYGVGI